MIAPKQRGDGLSVRTVASRIKTVVLSGVETITQSSLGLSRSRRALYKAHLLAAIDASSMNVEPFWNLEVHDMLHPELFAQLDDVRRKRRRGRGATMRREYDDVGMTRYSFLRAPEPSVRHLRLLFQDEDVKRAILKRFFVTVPQTLLDDIAIWDEAFEFTFSPPGKIQDMHIDWPTKFVSIVIYFPEAELSETEQLANATMVYDRHLVSQPRARFAANRGMMFAPHFESYHGFSTTRDRDALLIFLLNTRIMAAWETAAIEAEGPPFPRFMDIVQRKMEEYPMREFPSLADVEASRERSKVNMSLGRVAVPVSE